jgi:hypothetical protein
MTNVLAKCTIAKVPWCKKALHSWRYVLDGSIASSLDMSIGCCGISVIIVCFSEDDDVSYGF